MLVACENGHWQALNRQQICEEFGELAVLELDAKGTIQGVTLPAEHCPKCNSDKAKHAKLTIALMLLAISAVLGYYIFSPFNLIGLLN